MKYKNWNAGAFTKKTKTWEFKSLWFLATPFISCGALAFLPLLYMGIAGRKSAWIALGALSLAGIFTAFVANMGGLAAVFLYLADSVMATAFSFYFAKEYLQRKDLISKGFPLKWTKNYDYHNFNPEEEKAKFEKAQIKSLSFSESFISDLQKLEKEIESAKLKRDIQRMLEVSTIIAKKDNREKEIFFERNAETVGKILTKYEELEKIPISTPEIKENMLRMEATVENITKAFEQELGNMYKNDMLDIDAESKAFIQSLKNRGLIDNS